MAFRFLHTADLHLDSPLKSLAMRDDEVRDLVANATRQAFERMIAFCLAERLDALVIAGDLYDGEINDMATPLFLGREFQRLDQAGISVFIINGNHDADSVVTRHLALPPNVTRFPAKGGTVRLDAKGVAMHGVSFADKSAPQSLLPLYPRAIEGFSNIGLMHTSLGGAEGHSVYAPCPLPELVRFGYDYWALGHIHKRQVHSEAPFVVMPGMPQGRDIGEAGVKSATLVTIGDDRSIAIREVETSIATFERVEIGLEAAQDWDDLAPIARRRFAAARSKAKAAHLIARPVLVGLPQFLARLDRQGERLRAELRAAAEHAGATYIDKVEFQPRALEVKAMPPSGALDELARIIAEPPSPALIAEAIAALNALDAGLPGDMRGLFGDDEATLEARARALLASGGADVLARISEENA